MRCLVFADYLRLCGYECIFICRKIPGNLKSYIENRGHEAHYLLEATDISKVDQEKDKFSNNFLIDQIEDALETVSILKNLRVKWIVVDHYGLDETWEFIVRGNYDRLIVIDDLANRPHYCRLLLDQTLARDPHDYTGLVPSDALLLCGTKYSLLRPEFSA
jgi:UDP-2,4-diacetamido-2,4,6-trideoxy-beta-L-altropyranose hydrolase